MKFSALSFCLLLLGSLAARGQDGLYYVGSEAQEPLPLEFSARVGAVWDSNVNPTARGLGQDESLLGLNSSLTAAFVTMTPRTTLDVFGVLGATYYLDRPEAPGSQQFVPQVRGGFNYTHRFTERLRFVSRNFLAYELEPDLTRGFANIRQIDPFITWDTDNSVGYRWTERFATYSGFSFRGTAFGSNVPNQDRQQVTLYNQFRYQLTPQSVMTAQYRYMTTLASGAAGDSSTHFFLVGLEHRFSQSTILVTRAGWQFRSSDAVAGNDTSSPFLELALRSRINQQLNVRSFVRYGIEDFDTTRLAQLPGGNIGLYDFDGRQTLRIGTQVTYDLSPRLSLFAGLDYVPATFEDGRFRAPISGLGPFPIALSGLSEDLVNISTGFTLNLTERVFANFTYSYTHSDSDFDTAITQQSFDRNRISVGVSAQF
jgi:hypothetical protein